ncbi:DUF3108 domain-containing protein [Solimonas terrae]|uniref:DUF3108 domain-containing protein n=1 Tax=Solimonas terrae TaxID=1396819 RepID=A0A6M2BQ04_9GAMM|nr:DUF3108 domain-containing protein [Solimonas terrae]NGY04676.1 DUF3108 domain-containing protein [Solimonas terrae]
MRQLYKTAAWAGIVVAVLTARALPARAAAGSSAGATAAASTAAANANADVAEPAKLDADFWAPRADRYSVEWGSVSLGEGTISLKPTDDDCFEYHSETDPIAIVRWTYGSPSEFSTFCVHDGQVFPTHFQYSNDHRTDDNFTLDFDPKAQRVKMIQGGDITEIHVPDPVYDRFSIQEAVRLWAARNAGRIGLERDFAFLDEDKLRTYRFRIQPHETVKTPAGSFDTVLVERIDNPKKSYRYWLAPSREYIPVRIEHINKGKTELRMALLK